MGLRYVYLECNSTTGTEIQIVQNSLSTSESLGNKRPININIYADSFTNDRKQLIEELNRRDIPTHK